MDTDAGDAVRAPPVEVGDGRYAAVELFSGCGGLAYGLCQAAIFPEIMIEANAAAVRTLTENLKRGGQYIADWRPEQCDVRDMNWSGYRGRIAVVAGGPPCQPFSIGGRHQGSTDSRDMWPEAIRAVEDIVPKVFLFENVRGLLRENFATYFHAIMIALANANGGYSVSHMMVNAADFGAAQQRHRVIIAGVQAKMGPLPNFPEPTHSRERLLWDQWVSGDYWNNHSLPVPTES